MRRVSEAGVTIILGVSTGADIVFLADSRMSGMDTRGRIVVRQDVCQKLVMPNAWSLIGFTGHLCPARHLLRAFGNRLRATPLEAPDWLRDDDRVLGFLRSEVRAHAKLRLNSDHRSCLPQPTELLIAWVDHTRSSLGELRAPHDPNTSVRMELLAIRSPRCNFGERCLDWT